MSKGINQLKVLNVAQPNAHHIIFNGKNVENRSSACNFRGTIAIYASKTLNKDRFEDADIKPEDCTLGAIIGLVDLVDCITEEKVTKLTEEWFCGPYGYVLENVVILKTPVYVKPPQGAVIWWPLTRKDLDKCLAQVSADKIKEIVKVVPDKNALKPKTSGRVKLKPSVVLAAITGNEPISYKQAVRAVLDYVFDKKLFSEETEMINADEKLKALFGKKEYPAKDIKDLILANLN